MFGVHKTGVRLAAENTGELVQQIVPRGEHVIPVEIGKTVDGKENPRRVRGDFSVFTLPPGPPASAHLAAHGIDYLAGVRRFELSAAKRQKGIAGL